VTTKTARPNLLLLAESDAELREVYGGFLRNLGYEVVIAEHGLSCVEHLRQSVPEALVLDMDLVWGGGDGVLDWIRGNEGSCDVPVILTSAVDRRPRIADDAMPFVVGFLAKPFALTALRESVRAAIAKNRRQPNSLRQPSGHSELYIR
jgi:DNA-binding NtrC family response regulator